MTLTRIHLFIFCILSFVGSRCPKYDNVPSTCTFVPDPKDPACCRVPQCQGTGTGVQGFTGSFVGYGRPPNVDPTSLSNTAYGSKYCGASTLTGLILKWIKTYHSKVVTLWNVCVVFFCLYVVEQPLS